MNKGRESVQRIERICRISAREWERGNNSGDPVVLEFCENLCAEYQAQAERIAKQHGWTISYPGLDWVLSGPEFLGNIYLSHR